jgi:hypothetical protein
MHWPRGLAVSVLAVSATGYSWPLGRRPGSALLKQADPAAVLRLDPRLPADVGHRYAGERREEDSLTKVPVRPSAMRRQPPRAGTAFVRDDPRQALLIVKRVRLGRLPGSGARWTIPRRALTEPADSAVARERTATPCRFSPLADRRASSRYVRPLQPTALTIIATSTPC